MDNRSDIWLGVDAIKPRFIALSDRVWAMPEVCYTEARSAPNISPNCAIRVSASPRMSRHSHRLMGEWGEGGPVIAFLGEYDALPGLSQEAGVAEPRPIEAGGHGHGCGHNLLGSAALLAATAVKDWLTANKAPGRVRYYGLPRRGRACCENLHGALGRLAMTRHRHHLASEQFLGSGGDAVAGQYARRFRLHRARFACRRRRRISAAARSMRWS
jgi:hypothetical protein